MKTISLHQPCATLVAIGAKRYETRHWASFHTGALAIHAATTSSPELCAVVDREPFRSVLAAAGYQ